MCGQDDGGEFPPNATGFPTSFGPPSVASNMWVNSWISLFSERIEQPLVLTRGVWAGGARYGAVLWSSDIQSTFESLTAQVPLGVHASLSGIPWWTSDVGGFGCGTTEQPSTSDSFWHFTFSYLLSFAVR